MDRVAALSPGERAELSARSGKKSQFFTMKLIALPKVHSHRDILVIIMILQGWQIQAAVNRRFSV